MWSSPFSQGIAVGQEDTAPGSGKAQAGQQEEFFPWKGEQELESPSLSVPEPSQCHGLSRLEGAWSQVGLGDAGGGLQLSDSMILCSSELFLLGTLDFRLCSCLLHSPFC